MTVLERQVTTVEFERFLQLPENKERLFELINGEIVEKMPTEEHGMIVINIGAAIRIFLKQHQVGRVGAEIRYKLPADRYNSRMPDLSVNSRLIYCTRKPRIPIPKRTNAIASKIPISGSTSNNVPWLKIRS